MKNKVIILGGAGIENVITHAVEAARLVNVEVMSESQARERGINLAQKEPLQFKINPILEIPELNIKEKDFPRSKFFDKPRFNHRK